MENGMENKRFFVYVLKCRDETLYTGYTVDLEKRLQKHNEGKGAKYTRGRTPLELVYMEEGEDKSWAMSRENELKRLTRQQKMELLDSWKGWETMKVQQSFAPSKEGRGILYLVATPIGNLEDMTFRAVRLLKEADIIAAEDTRQTRKLLAHYEISTRLVSYHEHNKENSGPELIRLIKEGATIALVSDAGTPVISDPGHELVVLAIEEGIPVVPIPGANAAINALIGSGLDSKQFMFIGFLPRDKKSAQRLLDKLKLHEQTLIFYESPHRISKTLERINQAWGNRNTVLVRELTKKYEEWTRGTVESCLEWIQEHGAKGELCMVIEGANPEDIQQNDQEWWREMSVISHVDHYVENGSSIKEALKQTAMDRNRPKRDIYQEYHRHT
jgi:16S rRNA (cytidine1402-2'-O)-methyltransferase